MGKERLLVEVRSHAVIYDASHPFRKDNLKKDMAWKVTSEARGVNSYSLKLLKSMLTVIHVFPSTQLQW